MFNHHVTLLPVKPTPKTYWNTENYTNYSLYMTINLGGKNLETKIQLGKMSAVFKILTTITKKKLNLINEY